MKMISESHPSSGCAADHEGEGVATSLEFGHYDRHDASSPNQSFV